MDTDISLAASRFFNPLLPELFQHFSESVVVIQTESEIQGRSAQWGNHLAYTVNKSRGYFPRFDLVFQPVEYLRFEFPVIIHHGLKFFRRSALRCSL